MSDIDSSERRSALRYLSGLLMSLLGAAMGVPAALVLADPLRRRDGEAANPLIPEAIPVARLDEVPDLDKGAAPLRAAVVKASELDAWNRADNVKLGAVWLGRRGGEVQCLSTICPHAGCGIDYDAEQKSFLCPCHGSRFALDGSRREGPAPRDMDRLAVEVQDGQVRCRYQRFRLAITDKEAV